VKAWLPSAPRSPPESLQPVPRPKTLLPSLRIDPPNELEVLQSAAVAVGESALVFPTTIEFTSLTVAPIAKIPPV
jgi:hypothetical protein